MEKKEIYNIHVQCTNCDFQSRSEIKYDSRTYTGIPKQMAEIEKGKTVASCLN